MNRSRGVALIIALVVVALSTMMATRIGAQGALSQRRGAGLLTEEQAFQLALGAESWAIEILRDKTTGNSRRDSLDQLWAQCLPPIPVGDGDGTIEGCITDMQGRFNINSLVKVDGVTKDPVAYEQFTRLLEALQLEPKWADQVLDWIDSDTVVSGINGAEDSVYLGQAPPYRAANHLMTSTSELMALQGFGYARYQVLAPYIAALPPNITLNVCTASGLVLDTIAQGLTAFADDKQLATNREKGCFPLKADVMSVAQPLFTAPAQQALVDPTLGESSSWFMLRTTVRLPPREFTMYSLMMRNPGGFSRVITRTLGTE